ncbi:MAG: hypothetical protein WC595_04905 [Candidatus Nanoarchaeia archaeon]
MDLHISSLIDILNHQPVKPTYLIRVVSSMEGDYPVELPRSRFYVAGFEYRFDDTHPLIRSGVPLSDVMAEQMLREFEKERRNVEELVVVCLRGQNRSPAVGIALNEIFNLGQDSRALKKEYPEFNTFVYEKLIENAKRLKIK